MLVKVTDYCLWESHVVGSLEARGRLAQAEGLWIFLVAGKGCLWERMRQGKNESPTPGWKPVGDISKQHWSDLYKSERGQYVAFEALGPAELVVREAVPADAVRVPA